MVTVTAYEGDTMEPVGLMGQHTLSSKDGVATFVDIAFAKIATRLFLKFSSPSLPIATWGPINVVTGPGAYVVFALQPYGAQQGKLFSIQPIVKLSDATGNDVSTDSKHVHSMLSRRFRHSRTFLSSPDEASCIPLTSHCTLHTSCPSP